MKVLHLIKTPDGASWAQRQIAVLLQHGIEVEVAIPGSGKVADRYADLGVKTHNLETDLALFRSPSRFVTARSKLRKLITKERYDLIHSHFVGTTLFARLALGRRAKTPRLFQVPGPLHLENPITRNAEIATAGPRDYWMASCLATQRIYRQAGVAPERVGLSYYGLDIRSIPKPAGMNLREQIGLPKCTKIVGMVAYIYPPKRWLGQTRGLKGHEDLIDAGAILRKRGIDLACVFVGSTWGKDRSYENELRLYGSNVLGDRAIFLGNRNDVYHLYREFDLAVHPSHSENVGGACESLLLGVPTVATNVGGLPDLVVNGETGWLTESKSPELLAETIEKALFDPSEARRRASEGRKRAEFLFDVNRTAAEIVKEYEKIMAVAGATS